MVEAKPMGYEWDAFVSYRRSEHWNPYVDYLVSELDGLLNASLTRRARVFYDKRDIPFGAKWPRRLATAHSASRVLVPILWNEYFAPDSTWCREELSLMLERAMVAGADSARLVFPVVIFDTDLPEEVAELQYCDLRDVANPHTRRETKTAAKVWERLKPFVAEVADAVEDAPPHDDGWATLATDRFASLFSRGHLPQKDVPSLRGET